MGVRSPLTPTLSPLRKGGEGVGSGGDVIPTNGKRDILGRYRLKRKSVPGNSITAAGSSTATYPKAGGISGKAFPGYFPLEAPSKILNSRIDL